MPYDILYRIRMRQVLVRLKGKGARSARLDTSHGGSLAMRPARLCGNPSYGRGWLEMHPPHQDALK